MVRKGINRAILLLIVSAVTMTGCSLPWMKEEPPEEAPAAATTQEQAAVQQQQQQQQQQDDVIASGEGQIYEDTKLYTDAEEGDISPDGTPVITGGYSLDECVELCELNGLKVSVRYEAAPTMEDARVQAKFDKDAKTMSKYYEIEKGDIANVDMYAYINGKEDPNLSRTNMQVYVGGQGARPEIQETLIGMSQGTDRKVTVTYEEDFEYMDLGGKTVTYDIYVNSVASAEEPTEEEITSVYERLMGYHEQSDRQELYMAAKNAIEEASVIKAYPEKVVRQARARYERMMLTENTSIDDYLNRNGMTRAEFKQEEDRFASARVKDELILMALKEKSGLSESSDEYRDYVAQHGVNENDRDETMYEVIITHYMDQFDVVSQTQEGE